MASLAVILGLIFSRLGYPSADIVIGIIITFFIARIGYEIIRSASDTLVDTICIDTFAVEAEVSRIEGVKGCHGIRTRGTVHVTFLDLHVLVDPKISVEKAHEVADRVESAIKHRFPSVVDIVVHVEPDEKSYTKR
jgi:cation diffusion facilitator family transporter